MPKPFDKWTVLPHTPIEIVDENILCVEGPLGKFPRRMTIIRISGRRSIIHSGFALDESEMARVEDFGKPSFFVVPSAIHRMDVKPWKLRYPDMQVCCPPGAREKVQEIVKVDTIAPDFADPAVEFTTVDGTEQHESALIVKGAQGITLVINDIIFNVRKQPGVVGFIFGVLGVTGPEPLLPKVVMRKIVEDKSALRDQLEQWAKLDLKRIILAHGAPIEADPRGTLRKLAVTLA
jgi:hypothetical protein